jgi:hypothetical protein
MGSLCSGNCLECLLATRRLGKFSGGNLGVEYGVLHWSTVVQCKLHSTVLTKVLYCTPLLDNDCTVGVRHKRKISAYVDLKVMTHAHKGVCMYEHVLVACTRHIVVYTRSSEYNCTTLLYSTVPDYNTFLLPRSSGFDIGHGTFVEEVLRSIEALIATNDPGIL